MNNTAITHKGDITAIRIFDTELHFWFRSPTGDECDSGIMTMPCLNKEQATAIAQRYGALLGIDPQFVRCWEDSYWGVKGATRPLPSSQV
jgi:hypothetical protein